MKIQIFYKEEWLALKEKEKKIYIKTELCVFSNKQIWNKKADIATTH